MSTVLYNPTNELLTGMYIGHDFNIKSDEKRKVEDPKARHLLNVLAARGLSVLDYGDDEEEVAEKGRERNLAFKKKQITEHNQNNESRKRQSQSYVFPTKKIKEYAIELGIELDEPYTMRDAEMSALAEAKRENEGLKTQVTDLTVKLGKVLQYIDSQEAAKKEVVEEPQEEHPYENLPEEPIKKKTKK